MSLDEIAPKKAIDIIGESKVNVMKYIDDVFSCCISSSKADKLVLYEVNKQYSLRAQLHSLLIMPFGSGKSSSVLRIDDKLKEEATEFSLPGLIGSIDEDGNFIEGAVTRAGGKVLVVDEFHNLFGKPKNAMLSMLEEQRYSRHIARVTKMRGMPRGNKFRSIKIKKGLGGSSGGISVRSRFSCLCSGLYTPKVGINDKAWLSRFMPVQIAMSIPDIYKRLRGEDVFDVVYKPYDDSQHFTEWLKFLGEHEKIVAAMKETQKEDVFEEQDYIMRNAGDFARLWAWKNATLGNGFDWHDLLPYVPLSLRNYVRFQLSLEEYKILDVYRNYTIRDIANALNIDEDTVVAKIEKLKRLGLIFE